MHSQLLIQPFTRRLQNKYKADKLSLETTYTRANFQVSVYWTKVRLITLRHDSSSNWFLTYTPKLKVQPTNCLLLKSWIFMSLSMMPLRPHAYPKDTCWPVSVISLIWEKLCDQNSSVSYCLLKKCCVILKIWYISVHGFAIVGDVAKCVQKIVCRRDVYRRESYVREMCV